MGGKSRKQPKIDPIESLYAEHVDTKPLDVEDWREEWSDRRDDDEDQWWESQRCQECGEILTFRNGGGNEKHRECGGMSLEHDSDDLAAPPSCEGFIGACEGPMMNYAYPCDWRDGESAARTLVDLPLVPVVLRDGTHALALTGGGMDLSWEICAAYIALGFLPPLHHCRDLPRYVDRGLTERQRLVLDAAQRTAKVAEEWAQRAGERIRETRKWLASETRRIARERGRKGRKP